MEIKFAIALASMSILLVPGLAQNSYIPLELGGDNYYTMYGSPDISSSISGTDEFERGDTVTLYVDLTNYGRILGFKQDQMPQNSKEYALASAELEEENKKPTALGITATLVSQSPGIEVKSGDQVVESLKSGDRTQSPLKFTIKIGEHAAAGEYPLHLNMTYDYQDNVRVYASKLVTEGGTSTISNYRVSYVYQKANQTVPLTIKVKKQADFVIQNTTALLKAGGKKQEIRATYRNIGEDPVRDAVARLSIFKPFSSTDDQAFIGSLEPGNETVVLFRMDVDSDATPKEYGISSEIKYTDVNGDTVISESMKIPVRVEAAARSLLPPIALVVIILIALGAYIYKKRQNKA